MVSKDAIIECPFCKKPGIEAFKSPSYVTGKTSRISAGAKTTYHRVPERVIIVSNCPHCGKTKKEIQKKLDGEVEIDHKNVLERLRKQGLPTQIEF